MKKIIILTLALVCMLSLAACANTKPTQLGDSDFSIVLPKGYAMADDDLDEDQVAYFCKDDNSIDFDVYQWEKGEQYTLQSEADYFAAAYGTKAQEVVINGINGMKYTTEEEYEGEVYTVVNYMFEDDVYIVEICFWTVDSAEEYEAVDEIISTLKQN